MSKGDDEYAVTKRFINERVGKVIEDSVAETIFLFSIHQRIREDAIACPQKIRFKAGAEVRLQSVVVIRCILDFHPRFGINFENWHTL